jgi:hypothetical protein
LEDHAGDHSDSKASFDETQYRIHLTSFDGEPGSEAGTLACRERYGSEVVAFPEHHEWAIA